MTSSLLLVGFCAVMTAVAVGRLIAGDASPYRYGVASLVFGVTLLAGLWSAVRTGWAATGGRLVLGVGGFVLVVVGAALLARYWNAGPVDRA
ncbi:hypothetical protein [Natronococcus occultus]|uniref:Uncharacterized protein n=1 Tax=Natronococcus occultus SP4 TaxID=694430 RepID=L0JVW0_9EURY|nr:hypothetical protein [Natronococcus occultus]AGB36249.1 hypothetical protein Natoc_0384 [Natronococcus occultus SP4]